MYCTKCGRAMAAGHAFCGKCGTPVSGQPAQAGVMAGVVAGVVVRDVVRSQVAVGNGNVQVQVSVDGVSRISQRNGGVDLRPREIPPLPAGARAELVGRDTLTEQAWQALSAGRSVQLFGMPGVGRSAVAKDVLRRLAEAGTSCVALHPDNEPHTLDSLYRRLMEVFFDVRWYQPEEAVIRVEAARFGLRAAVMITDCDIGADDLSRLLGTFPGCTFLLTSHQRSLPDGAGTALEVDPLSPAEARELITRALGGAPEGLANLQWEEAYRLAGGQVQRLMEHVAFIRRAQDRPGQTGLLNVPIAEQVAMLVAGLSEPARRVAVALATYRLALPPGVFAAVTGLPAAADAAVELTAAGCVCAEGDAFRIAPDAAAVIAGTGERSDPSVAADGLMALFAGSRTPDPHLVLAVARSLHEAGDDAATTRLTRLGAPAALAAGAIGVWVSLVALGVQTATASRRKADLEFFLNEEHTGALLRGDTVAAAAALAALGEILAEQHPHAATHAIQTARHTQRALRLGRRGHLAGHLSGHPVAATTAAAVGVAAIAAAATVAIVPSGASALSVAGTWEDAGSQFSFTSSGPGSFRVSLASPSTNCTVADDGTVSGGNGKYQGTINLYPSSVSGCPHKTATASITISIAADGKTASVNIAGDSASRCSNCGQQTWTRKS